MKSMKLLLDQKSGSDKNCHMYTKKHSNTNENFNFKVSNNPNFSITSRYIG